MLLLCLVAGNASAQDWFPLHVGNQWILYPNLSENKGVVAWAIGNFMFVVNLDTVNAVRNIKIPPPHASRLINQYFSDSPTFFLQFSTLEETENQHNLLIKSDLHIILPELQAGEGRVYKM